MPANEGLPGRSPRRPSSTQGSRRGEENAPSSRGRAKVRSTQATQTEAEQDEVPSTSTQEEIVSIQTVKGETVARQRYSPESPPPGPYVPSFTLMTDVPSFAPEVKAEPPTRPVSPHVIVIDDPSSPEPSLNEEDLLGDDNDDFWGAGSWDPAFFMPLEDLPEVFLGEEELPDLD